MLVVDGGLFSVNFDSGAETQLSFTKAPKLKLKFNKAGVALFPTCDHLSRDASRTKRQLLSEIVMTLGITLPQRGSASAQAGILLDINIQVDPLLFQTL